MRVCGVYFVFCNSSFCLYEWSKSFGYCLQQAKHNKAELEKSVEAF